MHAGKGVYAKCGCGARENDGGGGLSGSEELWALLLDAALLSWLLLPEMALWSMPPTPMFMRAPIGVELSEGDAPGLDP